MLKRYVLAGVATNEARLREIGAVVRMLERSDNAEVAGIAEILNRYSTALELLDEYDHGTLKTPNGTEPAVQLDYEVARAVDDEVARKFPKNVMLGVERNDSFRGPITLKEVVSASNVWHSARLRLSVRRCSYNHSNSRRSIALRSEKRIGICQPRQSTAVIRAVRGRRAAN